MFANILYICARGIRRLPGIHATRFPWGFLRKVYYAVLNLDRAGVTIPLGGHIRGRVPAELTGTDWQGYEPECAAAVADFFRRCPGALFLDVGCSVGFYSVLALFGSRECEVIAFDSDIVSLKVARYASKYAGTKRLRLVHGFVSEEHTSRLGLAEAVTRTRRLLEEGPVVTDPRSVRYICIQGNTDSGIPVHSLDGLLCGGSVPAGTSLLIKCDVEGAEFLVLKGADRLLREWPVQLLIEIHAAMSEYGTSRAEIHSYLQVRGYRVTPVATKTGREYWWCKK